MTLSIIRISIQSLGVFVMTGLLSKDRIIAPDHYNRWRVPLASIAIHLCIGSVYAWSIYNTPERHGIGPMAGSRDRRARLFR